MATPVIDLTEGDDLDAITTWEDLRQAVKDSGNVLRVVMSLLSDLDDSRRLGIHVRASISRSLDGLGLGHLPADIPGDKYAVVTLYKRGTPAASVIDAIYRDGGSKAAEIALRRLNTSQDAERLLAVSEKVAEINAILHDEQ